MPIETALESQIEAMSALNAKFTRSLRSFLETQLAVSDTFVDPTEALLGEDGELWSPIGAQGAVELQPYRTDAELDATRNTARGLAIANEFAINGHENRISYIVGTGHVYTVVAKKGVEFGADRVQAMQDVIDEFVKFNKWHHRQQESVLRRDRDGEVFLRFFPADDGILRVRYIEPGMIRTPQSGLNGAGAATFGIETDTQDAETIISYRIVDAQGVTRETVDAAEIQHRKRAPDSGWKRGLPIFWPVRKNLKRAAKILRNMSSVAEIQAAIALIRKHAQATASTVKAFASSSANVTRSNSAPGFGTGESSTRNFKRYGPGTILDAPQGVEYEFPAKGIDPGKFVSALQAELRAVASRLVMPEFMLTSDASNANFSSTLVAEGPAVKMFQRLQHDEITFDREVMDRVLAAAAAEGRFAEADLGAIELQIEPPIVQTRDKLAEAQVAQILSGLQWLSPQTGSSQFGLDYEQEQSNFDAANERQGLPMSGDRPSLPPAPGEDG